MLQMTQKHEILPSMQRTKKYLVLMLIYKMCAEQAAPIFLVPQVIFLFLQYNLVLMLDKSVYRKTIFLISHPKHMLWVPLKNRLNETVLFSIQNTCLK